MLELTLPTVAKRATRILCLGAHCDDIEIGCGGTLLKWLSGGGTWDVTWVVFSARAERERELRASAGRFLRRARRSRVITYQFRESFFPASYALVKEAFESLKQLPAPDIIFTHEQADLHQDHRLLAELTWNTFRRHLVLEYEIPKYEGGLTTPNVYVTLTRAQAAAKIRTLLACYESQHARPWFRAETFDALMRLRAVESGSGGGWAEGFHARKINIA